MSGSMRFSDVYIDANCDRSRIGRYESLRDHLIGVERMINYREAIYVLDGRDIIMSYEMRFIMNIYDTE